MVMTVFLFPVFGGILTQFLRTNLGRRSNYYSLLIIFVALLSVFNANRIIDGDLTKYLQYYRELEGITLTNFLILFGSEPVFYALSWIVGTITGFSNYLFIYTTSFLGFFLLAISSFRLLSLKVKYQYFAAAVCACTICIFPLIFSNSLQLIRQFIAMGLFLYGLSHTDRSRYFWWVMAYFTHVSSIILIVFSLTNKRFRLLQMIASVLIIVATISGSFFKDSLLSSSSSQILYIFSRVGQENFHDMEGLNMFQIYYLYLFLIFSAFLYSFTRLDDEQIFTRTLAQILLSLGLVIVLLNQVFLSYEPAARLFFYFVTLSILILFAWFVRWFNYRFLTSSLIFFSVLPFWIAIYLGMGTWQYEIPDPMKFLSPLMNIV